MPSVSLGFILSCWKHCDLVEQCVDSILSQAYPYKKIILQGESCVHEIPGVLCVNDGQRRGRVARLNMGVKALDTDYVTFFGVDDYLCSHILVKVADIIESTGKREWYYGWHKQDHNGEIRDVTLQPFDYERLRRENYIAGGAVFLRRDIALKHGFYGIGKKGLGDDWIQWYRTGMKYPPVVMNIPVYVERIGTTTTRAAASANPLRALWNRRQYKFRRYMVHLHLIWLYWRAKLQGAV